MPRDARTAAPPTDDIVVMDDIRKVYDTGKVKVEALKGVTFTIRKGEFVAIVGPSGSGKSTLMNLIGCLDTPTSGVYRLGGEAVAGLTRDQLADVRNRRVGFVFQSFNLLPQISSQENVEMPMLFGGVPPKERHARAAEQGRQALRAVHQRVRAQGGGHAVAAGVQVPHLPSGYPRRG